MEKGQTYKVPRAAWYVAFVFFLFMPLHNADKFLISPLLTMIRDEFKLTYTELGTIQMGSVLVAVAFMPIWGYLFDRYARPPLVALASAIWGGTTILSTMSTNYLELIVTRAMIGIDNEATSGVVSFLGDYFPPEKRSTVLGILYTSNALGALIGVFIRTLMSAFLGWRSAFVITAVPGLLLAALVIVTVKDRLRGATEPELLRVRDRLKDTFSGESLVKLLKLRSTALLFAQGFFGVFPWQILSYWLFTYMEDVRHFNSEEMLMIMLAALLAMVVGNVVAGVLSDWSFKRSLRVGQYSRG